MAKSLRPNSSSDSLVQRSDNKEAREDLSRPARVCERNRPFHLGKRIHGMSWVL